ncbi:MAG: exopolyphosphatase, partial [Paracoccaceae bacterium]
IVNGEEEARLSAQGVLLGWPGSYGLVCDIGGSSMELAEISGGIVGKRTTSDLGPLQLKEIKGGAEARAKAIKTAVKELAKQMGPQHNRLFLVGGSWRTLARIDMHRRGYPLHVLHEYRMDSTSVHETIDYLANEDHAELRVACGVSENRMALVPYAAEVLHRLLKEFKPADIAISSYGIREGMLYEVMPDDMRAADPLLAACRFVEEKDARVPGFGDRLYEFVTPLFADAEEDFQRIIRAACLLHDVSWRAHPDFRANLCFETATRSNLGGLKHWERVFLGVSLLHRYRNKREGSPYSDWFPLLSDTQI